LPALARMVAPPESRMRLHEAGGLVAARQERAGQPQGHLDQAQRDQESGQRKAEPQPPDPTRSAGPPARRASSYVDSPNRPPTMLQPGRRLVQTALPRQTEITHLPQPSAAPRRPIPAAAH